MNQSSDNESNASVEEEPSSTAEKTVTTDTDSEDIDDHTITALPQTSAPTEVLTLDAPASALKKVPEKPVIPSAENGSSTAESPQGKQHCSVALPALLYFTT